MFNKKIGQAIPRQKGNEMIERYQAAHPGGVKSIFFGSETLKSLLAIEGAVGVQFFFAHYEDGVPTLVLKPVDASGKIISPAQTAARLASANEAHGGVVNVGNPCPPYCPSTE